MYRILDAAGRIERVVATLNDTVGNKVRLRLHAFAEYWGNDPLRYKEIREAIKKGIYTEEAVVCDAYTDSLLVEFPKSGSRTVVRKDFLRT
jgi:hypothetical protein